MTANIFTFIGQSNAEAVGTDNLPFPGWVSDPYIKIWNYFTQQWETYQPGVNSSWMNPRWGPEAQFAVRWRLDNPGCTIYLRKQAVGGSTLYPYPDPAVPDWSPRSIVKKQWMLMIEQTYAAMSALTAPKLCSTLMFQGESEAALDKGASYLYDLLEFTDVSRSALNAPNMRFVFARASPTWTNQTPSGPLVREAQQTVGSLLHNAWIDTDDISQSGGHIDVAGTILVGNRMYDADKAIA